MRGVEESMTDLREDGLELHDSTAQVEPKQSRQYRCRLPQMIGIGAYRRIQESGKKFLSSNAARMVGPSLRLFSTYEHGLLVQKSFHVALDTVFLATLPSFEDKEAERN
jgi:hypothetical protein